MYIFKITPKDFKTGSITKAIGDLREAEGFIKRNELRVVQMMEQLIKKKGEVLKAKKYLLENIRERRKNNEFKIT